MKNEQITEIAKAVTREESEIAVKCLQAFAGTQVATVANGICNTLIAYNIENDKVPVSDCSRAIARAIIREQLGIVIKCLRVFGRTPVSFVVEKITKTLTDYTQDQ